MYVYDMKVLYALNDIGCSVEVQVPSLAAMGSESDDDVDIVDESTGQLVNA